MKILAAILLLIISHTAQAERINIANMSSSQIDDWSVEAFQGLTDYRMVNIEGERALLASSKNSASGLYRKQRIDLRETPFLNWRWRVEKPLNRQDEQSKQGDDYAARIYALVSGGMAFWRTKALNYVWSSSQPVGTQWDNAYTSQAKMVVIESGNQNVGQWRVYKRNVAEDMRELFGEEVTHIDGIAIMTDTDNSQGEAKAYYGDIYFSRD